MDADVEISKPGESSHSVAAKDVKITTTIDTLVKAMYNFHYEGEEACIGMFPQDARGAINILKKLLETFKQSKTGLLALDNNDRYMVGKELLKVNKLELSKTQIVDVTPLAALVHLTNLQLSSNQIVDVEPLATLVNLWHLYLDRNPIVDTSPLRSLPKHTKIYGVVVRCRCCTIV